MNSYIGIAATAAALFVVVLAITQLFDSINASFAGVLAR